MTPGHLNQLIFLGRYGWLYGNLPKFTHQVYIQVIANTLIVEIGPCGIILGVSQIILITSPRKHSLWTQTYTISSRRFSPPESGFRWREATTKNTSACPQAKGNTVMLVFSYIQICLPSNSTWGIIQKIINYYGTQALQALQ